VEAAPAAVTYFVGCGTGVPYAVVFVLGRDPGSHIILVLCPGTPLRRQTH